MSRIVFGSGQIILASFCVKLCAVGDAGASREERTGCVVMGELARRDVSPEAADSNTCMFSSAFSRFTWGTVKNRFCFICDWLIPKKVGAGVYTQTIISSPFWRYHFKF